jgi:hypothetical protein
MERQLFKIAYPKTFNYLFEHNIADPRMPQDSFSEKRDVIITELGSLQRENSLLFQRLTEKRGVEISSENKITIGEPR